MNFTNKKNDTILLVITFDLDLEDKTGYSSGICNTYKCKSRFLWSIISNDLKITDNKFLNVISILT